MNWQYSKMSRCLIGEWHTDKFILKYFEVYAVIIICHCRDKPKNGQITQTATHQTSENWYFSRLNANFYNSQALCGFVYLFYSTSTKTHCVSIVFVVENPMNLSYRGSFFLSLFCYGFTLVFDSCIRFVRFFLHKTSQTAKMFGV